MEKEQFEKSLVALLEQRNTVEKEIHELQRKYIVEHPIQAGDACRDEHGKLCWLSRMFFPCVTSRKPDVMVNYERKDGTRSNRDQHAYGDLVKLDNV